MNVTVQISIKAYDYGATDTMQLKSTWILLAIFVFSAAFIIVSVLFFKVEFSDFEQKTMIEIN